jgi:hypothetical protein
LVQRPYGEVRRLTAAGWEGAINLPKLSEEFYRSARWLRVYTSSRLAINPRAIVALATMPAHDVRHRLEEQHALLS